MESSVRLSRRLQAAAEFVRDGSVVADVGCDHGKLAAYLLDSGKAAYVFATDIREQPLEKAAALLSSRNYDRRSECVLTDGVQGLPGDRITDVVIAGVGDDVTEKIIRDAPRLYDPGKRLVLVPSSKHERVRTFLAKECFSVISESAVFDKGHSYTVICCCYDGVIRESDIAEKWLGGIDVLSEDGRKYAEVLQRRMSAVAEGIRDENDPVKIEAEELLSRIDAALETAGHNVSG